MLIRGRVLQCIFTGLITGGIFFGVGSNPNGYANMQSISGGNSDYSFSYVFFLSITHFTSALSPELI